MSRKIRLPKPRKRSRNLLAKSLATGKYGARVMPKVGAYRRRPKHAKPAGDEGQ